MHVLAYAASQSRNKQSMYKLQRDNRSPTKRERKYTVGVFCSGGCLDTIAAMRCGFRPVWGTEVCHRKRALWSSLTGTPDLGDTFSVRWNYQTIPDFIQSGQPCMDYSSSGSKKGEFGPTGYMFVKQCEQLLMFVDIDFDLLL